MTDANDALKARLLRGAHAMQIELSDAQTGALMDYLGLFQKRNKA